MRGLTVVFAPSQDVFVARRRREWRWARRPNYELFSPRHGAPRCRFTVRVRTYLLYLAPPLSSRVRARKSARAGDATRDDGGWNAGHGVEDVRTSLRDSRRHLWECDTSFSSDALLRFRIVTQPSFSRPRHPRAPRQRESMSMRAAVSCTRPGEERRARTLKRLRVCNKREYGSKSVCDRAKCQIPSGLLNLSKYFQILILCFINIRFVQLLYIYYHLFNNLKLST